MRHKTSGYFLLSALLVSLILGLCILLNLRCPQAVSDDALTQEQLTRGVTLTGWQQTGPGHWRFAFEAPADVPELVLCLSTRSLDAVPEGLTTLVGGLQPFRHGVVRPSGCGRCPAGRPRSL